MQIDIRSRGVRLNPTIKSAVGKRLSFALDRFQRLIAMARVRLEDVNGPKGGVDTVCRIAADGPLVGRVVVEERSIDAASAIDGAVERLAQVLARVRGRAVDFRRRPPPPKAPRRASRRAIEARAPSDAGLQAA